MSLFNKEKDTVLKITNLVLIVWFVGAITIFGVGLANIIYPEEILTYDEYEFRYCKYYTYEEVNRVGNCESNYDMHVHHIEQRIYENNKQLIITFGNIIIIGIVIFVLNRKKGNNENV